MLAQTSAPLAHLNIRYNHLGAEGGTAIALALKETSAPLAYLNLKYNYIGEEGRAALSSALDWRANVEKEKRMLAGLFLMRRLRCGMHDRMIFLVLRFAGSWNSNVEVKL